MKRLLVLTAVLLMIAAPAQAVHKGQVCKTFAGPDGAGGVNLRVCLVVDDHDFQDQIRAMVVYDNMSGHNTEIHVSYLKLVKGSTDVRWTGPFVATINSPHAYFGEWYNNPNGTFHSRIRMWVCWPTLPGDPCGSVVTWNSGNASY